MSFPIHCPNYFPAATSAIFFLLLLSNISCQATLSPNFYDKTCPNALSAIRTSIRTAVAHERRMAASLIRLHFHDCFVEGCDASILLNDSASIRSEKNAAPNRGSVRGFEIIDAAKSAVEKICPGIVSCADIVAAAARDASVAVGGPSWTVKLGRRDSTTAFFAKAEGGDLPNFRESLDGLISLFKTNNLSPRDLVALSGAHTIGQAQCFTFRDRIYNGTNIDAGFASTRRRRCPRTAGSGDSNLAALDLVTANSFDNNFFKNLIQKKGLLETDQVLFSGGSTDSIVSEYSTSPSTFRSDFGAAMVRMGDKNPLTGQNGQVRRICSAVN